MSFDKLFDPRAGVYFIFYEVMVTTSILSFDPCTKTNYEDLTRCLEHLNTGLNTASNVKPSRMIVNITR